MKWLSEVYKSVKKKKKLIKPKTTCQLVSDLDVVGGF